MKRKQSLIAIYFEYNTFFRQAVILCSGWNDLYLYSNIHSFGMDMLRIANVVCDALQVVPVKLVLNCKRWRIGHY